MAAPEDNFPHSERYGAVLVVLSFILLPKNDCPMLPQEFLPMHLIKYRLHVRYFSGTWKILCLIVEFIDLIIMFLCTPIKKQFNKLSSIKHYSDRCPLSAHGASSLASSPSL